MNKYFVQIYIFIAVLYNLNFLPPFWIFEFFFQPLMKEAYQLPSTSANFDNSA